MKPDMWQDEDFGTTSIEAQALFVGLITQADDEGRLKGSAARMRALIWPYKTDLDAARIEEWLDELQSAGLVDRYEVAEKQYLALPGWSRHQRIDKPTASEIPAPHGPDSQTLGNGREDSRGLSLDRKGKEGSKEGSTSSLRSDAVEPGLDVAAAVRDLFAYWQERCEHDQAKLTEDRKRKVRARLREGYSPADIRRAIDGAAVAPFVNGDGKTFDDLELICRTGSKVESFMQRAKSDPAEKTARLVGKTRAPT